MSRSSHSHAICCLVPVVGTPAADVYNYYYRLAEPAPMVYGGRLYEATLVYAAGDGAVVCHRRDNMR